MPAPMDMDLLVVFAKCECCGLTEECTPAYVDTIRQRYQGRWICGLCAEAVKDEISRSQMITTEEAMARHISFCRSIYSTTNNPTVELIAAMKHILRRGLDSMPNSPSKSSSSSNSNSNSYRGMQLSRSEDSITSLELESSSSFSSYDMDQ